MFRTTLIAAAAATFVSSAAFGAVITEWTFEGDVTTPSTGSGTASLIGGTTSTFATGNGGGRGWNTTTYPAQSTNSGTAGVQFLVDTTGFGSIGLTFDHRASGTASRFARIDYTVDGTTWTPLTDNAGGLSPHDTFYSFGTYAFPASADNNPNFGVRIVSIFSPLAFDQNASLPDYAAGSAYMRANAQASFTPGGGTGTGDYGTTGTWRFDNVAIFSIPEPATLGVIAGLGLVALRRR
jgi:hypothetical protein